MAALQDVAIDCFKSRSSSAKPMVSSMASVFATEFKQHPAFGVLHSWMADKRHAKQYIAMVKAAKVRFTNNNECGRWRRCGRLRFSLVQLH